MSSNPSICRELFALAVGLTLVGCLAPQEERMHCDDLLPPDEATFDDVLSLVIRTDGTGCAASKCHGSEVAEHGYRLDEPVLVHDALTSKIDVVYGQIAGGEMPPEEDGTPWSSNDLQLLRSWYCNGAFPSD